MSGSLPAGFSALDPFVSWALPSERERHAKAIASPMAVVREFYDAMLPVLPVALDHLNTLPLGGLPEGEQRLLDLCLAMIEAAAAVEMFDEVNPPYLMPVERFEPVHDRWTRS